MKIQQHDGVVVDAGHHSSRATPYTTREREVLQGRGRRQGSRGLAAPSLPPFI